MKFSIERSTIGDYTNNYTNMYLHDSVKNTKNEKYRVLHKHKEEKD